MKKRYMMLSILCLLLFVFTSCSNENSKQSDSFGFSTVNSNASDTPLLNQLTKLGVSNCATQNGYYYIERNTIYYIDYASQKRIALCNRPECQHKDETCAAKVERYAVIFSTNEHLYLYYPEGTGLLDSQNTVSRIDVMEMDGSNRKTFYTFDPYDAIIEDIYTDGKYFYFILNSCDVENGEYFNVKYELVRLDLETAEKEKIKDCVENEFLMGGTSDWFFIKKLIYPSERNLNTNLKHQAFAYDRKNRNEISIIEWDNLEAVGYFNSGALYLVDYDTFDIIKINLISQQRTTLVQGEDILSQIGTDEREKYYPSLQYISEDYVYFGLAQVSGEKNLFGIDIKNQKVKEFNQSYEIHTEHDKYDQFWTILASTEGQYLICYGVQEVPFVDTLINGAQLSRTVYENQYALITEQDFFEGNVSSLIPIENVDLVWG